MLLLLLLLLLLLRLLFLYLQVLKDTGVHHMHLLLTLSRLSTMCFLPFWLLFDVTRMINDQAVVS